MDYSEVIVGVGTGDTGLRAEGGMAKKNILSEKFSKNISKS